MKRNILIGVIVVVVLGLGIFLFIQDAKHPKDAQSFEAMTPRELALACNAQEYTVMHIHPHLDLLVEGKDVEVPANIGIQTLKGCLHALHTHDNSGTLHVESPVQKDFTLGDFFAVWGKAFTKDQILEYKADDTHKVTMTVNGKESTDFENLLLKDKDQIVISYDKK
jgi:hypothetical protein